MYLQATNTINYPLIVAKAYLIGAWGSSSLSPMTFNVPSICTQDSIKLQTNVCTSQPPLKKHRAVRT